MLEPFDLSPDQCRALLRAGIAGRLALSTPTGPHIVPVNYSVVGDHIVVRTSPYSLLGTYGRDSTVAFEVDQFDYEYQHGWSVVARGRATAVTDPAALDKIRSAWSPQPWAAGSRNLFMQVPLTELSGRQLGGGWDPGEALGWHRQDSAS